MPPKPVDDWNQSKNPSQGQSDLAWFTKVWARVCYFGRNPANLSSCVTPAKAAASQSAAAGARQHPGLHLQIIVFALPRHFFLMRFETVYALLDFVAL